MTFNNIYRGERVWISGHTGFKGSWLSAWLLHLGAEVYGFSKDVPTQPSLFELGQLSDRLHHCLGDVRDFSAVIASVQAARPRFVFHLAAQAIVSSSYREPLETITTNVVGTANVLEALREVSWPCAAVIVTSDKCYDNMEWLWGYRENDALGGKDVYSGSKGAAELVFKSYWHSCFRDPALPVRLATARAGNVIGGGDWAADRIVADCMRAWSSGQRVPVRSPAATRPWQHALEPLSGYLTLAQQLAQSDAANGQSYNLGPRAEQNHTVLELLGDLSRVWGFASTQEAYEVVGNAPFHEASLLKLNCDKALIELKWESTLTYAECMSMTGHWYRDVLRENKDAWVCTLAQIQQYETLAAQRQRRWVGDQ